jgi:hypothetical protein
VFSPFPTAIYNVFSPSTRDDYITAIGNARKNLKLSSDQIEFSTDAKRKALFQQCGISYFSFYDINQSINQSIIVSLFVYTISL